MANNKLSLNAIVRVDSKKGGVEYLYTLQKYITVIGVKKLANSYKRNTADFSRKKKEVVEEIRYTGKVRKH